MKRNQYTVHLVNCNGYMRDFLSQYFIVTSQNEETSLYDGVICYLDHVSEFDEYISEEWLQNNTQSHTPLFIIHSSQISKNLKTKNLSQPIIEIQIPDPKCAHLQFKQLIHYYLSHPPQEESYVVEKINNSTPVVGVVGLGYVGLPVAVGFSEKFKVIGFDIDERKIKALKNNIDITGEISKEELKRSKIKFTSYDTSLSECDVIIVAVPTPLTQDKKPDLTFLKKASELIATHMNPGVTIIYESTVFPGATEEVCIPILEKISHLKVGIDFYVGYSPERINPGDKEHTFKRNNKVVSGQNEIALNKIYTLYKEVLDGEVFKAPSIKVAEASKIVENTQRDANIALINELSLIFNKLNIDTQDVLTAASTKWNFLPFTPGLVGGHCIGVDPYYLIYRANKEGIDPHLITTAREINDNMPNFIVNSLLKLLVKHKFHLADLHINVFGITFKEDTADLRNSKALEIVDQLQQLGLSVDVFDPYVNKDDLKKSSITLKSIDELKQADVVIYTVAHEKVKGKIASSLYSFIKKNGVLMDIKGVIPKECVHQDTILWRL